MTAILVSVDQPPPPPPSLSGDENPGGATAAGAAVVVVVDEVLDEVVVGAWVVVVVRGRVVVVVRGRVVVVVRGTVVVVDGAEVVVVVVGAVWWWWWAPSSSWWSLDRPGPRPTRRRARRHQPPPPARTRRPTRGGRRGYEASGCSRRAGFRWEEQQGAEPPDGSPPYCRPGLRPRHLSAGGRGRNRWCDPRWCAAGGVPRRAGRPTRGAGPPGGRPCGIRPFPRARRGYGRGGGADA